MKFADGVKGARRALRLGRSRWPKATETARKGRFALRAPTPCTGQPLFRLAGLPAQQAVQQQDHGQGRKPGEPYRRQDLHGGGGAGLLP